MLPPLIITAAELDRVCEILDLALTEASRPLAAA
jgi:4-aminobutyrate aminotransferase-like enzyme